MDPTFPDLILAAEKNNEETESSTMTMIWFIVEESVRGNIVWYWNKKPDQHVQDTLGIREIT